MNHKVHKEYKVLSSLFSSKISLFSVVTLFLLLVGGFFLLTKEEGEKEKVISSSPPQVEVATFRLMETKEGKKEWVLEAEKASQSKDKTGLSKFKTEFFLGSETKSLTLSGNSGIIKEKSIEAFEDVKAKSSSGMEVSTPYLRWDSDSKKITTPDSAVIIDEGVVIKGQGLDLDPEKEKVEMKKVRIEIR